MKLITANKLKRFWNNGIIPELKKKLDKTRVLKTTEEIEANTNDENVPSAVVVGELINNLGGVRFIFDDDGKIIGYKSLGGADTVFPFSSLEDMVLMRFSLSGGYSGAINIQGGIPGSYKKITISGLQKGATMVVGGIQISNGTTYLEEPMTANENGSYSYSFSTVYQPQGTTDGNPGVVTLSASM